jgi:hypothetical protein
MINIHEELDYIAVLRTIVVELGFLKHALFTHLITMSATKICVKSFNVWS